MTGAEVVLVAVTQLVTLGAVLAGTFLVLQRTDMLLRGDAPCKRSEPATQPNEPWDQSPDREAPYQMPVPKPTPILIPQEVLDYCEQESDSFAEDSCLERWREAFVDLNQDAAKALARVQRQDGEVK